MHELRQKIEIYLLPSGFNSLSAYIAANDPLYRQSVFQYFSIANEHYASLVRPGGIITAGKNQEDKEKLQLFQNILQKYFREAKRTVDVKIFKCEIIRDGVDKNEVMYFTNRIEIGCLQ